MLQDLQIIEATNSYNYHSKILSVQQRYNHIFAQLRLKNSTNQKLIDCYVQKMEKHHNLFYKINRKQSLFANVSSLLQPLTKKIFQQPKIKKIICRSQTRKIHDRKDSLLNKSNLRHNECSNLLTSKICSLIIADKHSLPKLQEQQQHQQKQKQENIKIVAPSTHKYCKKNLLSSKLHYSQRSNEQRPNRQRQSNQKYQLSIKSLMFGSQQLVSTQRDQKDTHCNLQSARILTQPSKQVQISKMDKSNQLFHDHNFTNKKALSSAKLTQEQSTKILKHKLSRMYLPQSHRAISVKYVKRLSQSAFQNARIHSVGSQFKISQIKSLLQ